MAAPERKKMEYFRDTVHRVRRKFDSTLFTAANVPSTSDYAEDLGRIYELLNKESGIMQSFVKIPVIRDYLNQGDCVLDILKERLFQTDQSFNIRNLQMFNALLDVLDRNTVYYASNLGDYDSALDDVREDIAELKTDTLMHQLFRDTALKNLFQPQLQQLKVKWSHGGQSDRSERARHQYIKIPGFSARDHYRGIIVQSGCCIKIGGL